MRRSGEEQEVVVWISQLLSELIAFGLIDFIAAASRAFGIRATLVRLVNNHQVPMLLPYPLAHVILLRVIEGRDDLRFPLPKVDELLLVVACVNDLKGLAEEPQEFVLPLDRQRRWHQNEN